MPELQPGQTVLVATDGFQSLVFGTVVCSYDGNSYAVELPSGELMRRAIPDAEAILPHWMATPADVRAFMSREFRLDLAVMRNQAKLTPDQLECLAREEMKLNAVERMTAH